MCHKSHPGKCQKTKTTAVVPGADNICPVCSKQAHKYKTMSGAEGILKRIKDCPGFKAATDKQKQEMVKKIKKSCLLYVLKLDKPRQCLQLEGHF